MTDKCFQRNLYILINNFSIYRPEKITVNIDKQTLFKIIQSVDHIHSRIIKKLNNCESYKYNFREMKLFLKLYYIKKFMNKLSYIQHNEDNFHKNTEKYIFKLNSYEYRIFSSIILKIE